MSDNTYVSHFTRNRRGRRQLFADKDLYGKNVFSQTLFENLKRFWKNYHNDNKRFFWWIEILLERLERSIRIKWLADLSKIELFLRLFKDKYEQFNPENFEENSEDYFIHLQEWKVETEKDYQNFTPRRHRKILGPPRRESIRGWFFVFLIYLRNVLLLQIFII